MLAVSERVHGPDMATHACARRRPLHSPSPRCVPSPSGWRCRNAQLRREPEQGQAGAALPGVLHTGTHSQARAELAAAFVGRWDSNLDMSVGVNVILEGVEPVGHTRPTYYLSRGPTHLGWKSPLPTFHRAVWWTTAPLPTHTIYHVRSVGPVLTDRRGITYRCVPDEADKESSGSHTIHYV